MVYIVLTPVSCAGASIAPDLPGRVAGFFRQPQGIFLVRMRGCILHALQSMPAFDFRQRNQSSTAPALNLQESVSGPSEPQTCHSMPSILACRVHDSASRQTLMIDDDDDDWFPEQVSGSLAEGAFRLHQRHRRPECHHAPCTPLPLR